MSLAVNIGSRVGIFSIVVMLCGCDLPTAEWSKPGVSAGQYADDSAACNEAVTENDFGVGGAAGANKRAYYEKCMTDRGYQKVGEKGSSHLHSSPGILVPTP